MLRLFNLSGSHLVDTTAEESRNQIESFVWNKKARRVSIFVRAHFRVILLCLGTAVLVAAQRGREQLRLTGAHRLYRVETIIARMSLTLYDSTSSTMLSLSSSNSIGCESVDLQSARICAASNVEES